MGLKTAATGHFTSPSAKMSLGFHGLRSPCFCSHRWHLARIFLLLASGPGLHSVSAAGGRPKRPVTVLGTGFGRTGTSSIAKALVDMGYTEGLQIYNMRTVVKNSKTVVADWIRIAEEHAGGHSVTRL